jgi:hypothetical protein
MHMSIGMYELLTIGRRSCRDLFGSMFALMPAEDIYSRKLLRAGVINKPSVHGGLDGTWTLLGARVCMRLARERFGL